MCMDMPLQLYYRASSVDADLVLQSMLAQYQRRSIARTCNSPVVLTSTY